MASSETLHVWTGGVCAGPPGYGYGGWAWLVVHGGAARGAAGGERHTTAGAMALRGTIEGLKAAATEPAAPLQLDPGDLVLARIGADLAARRAAGWRTAEGDPIDNPELWEQVATLVAARAAPVRFAFAAKSDAKVFVDAWTAFARDRCKDKGPFTSAIPRPNLTAFMARAFQG
jgi:ribonuclease HI